MSRQYVCRTCRAIVMIPAKYIYRDLGPNQQAAKDASQCMDCFGVRKVKSL